jgi:hypothetical protein
MLLGTGMDACLQMMPRVYIGRRGEAGKSEDVKKMEMDLGSGFLFYSISPYFPVTYSADRSALPSDI